jgi:hypothetical protein
MGPTKFTGDSTKELEADRPHVLAYSAACHYDDQVHGTYITLEIN